MDIKKIKTYLVNTVIGIIFTGVLSLIPFYYNTTNTLAQHSKGINGNTTNVEKLDKTIRDNEQSPIVIQGEIELIKKDIEYIIKKQDEQEVTLQKIYDIVIELKTQNN